MRAGIELERIPSGILRLRQDTCSKLELKLLAYRGLLTINSVIKRLRLPSKDRFGLYFRSLKLPIRVLCVCVGCILGQ